MNKGDNNVKLHLSMCMIARDNERTLSAALESIKPWVDEMVVVDTGSTDRTRQIAEEHGARVFEFAWCDDFAAARNESLRHASGDWILWMDSDDTISEDNGRQLRELINSPEAESRTAFVLQVHCGGGDGKGGTVVDHVKLIRNLPGVCFEGRIHEQVLPSIRRLGGEVGWTDIFISHSGADYSPEGLARKLERDMRILTRDLEERPDHPFVLFNLGMTYGNAGDHAKAVSYLTRCIDVSDTGESHVRKAYALLVGSLNQQGESNEARRRCWEGLGRYPNDPELLFLSGTLAQHAGLLQEASDAYLRILQSDRPRHFSSLDPGIVGYKTHQNLAVVLEGMGRWPEAEAHWRAIYAEQPSYREGWRGLVDNLIHQHKLDDMETLINDAGEGNGTGAELAIARARVAIFKGQMDRAKKLLYKALAKYPENSDLHHALCKHLFETQDEDAEAALLRLAELAPEDGAVVHNLGLLMMKAGQLERAVEHFERSLELRPHSAHTHYYRGVACQELGCTEDASASLGMALRIDPQHHGARQALAKLAPDKVLNAR